MKNKEQSADDAIKERFQQFYLTKKGKKKQIKERDEKITRKDYSNESSPYHEWREAHGNVDQEGDAIELDSANPDIIGEDKSLYYYKPNLDEELLEQINLARHKLTNKQLRVLNLIAEDGKSLESCGVIMGLSRGNVLDLLNRARKTIQSELKKASTKVDSKRIK